MALLANQPLSQDLSFSLLLFTSGVVRIETLETKQPANELSTVLLDGIRMLIRGESDQLSLDIHFDGSGAHDLKEGELRIFTALPIFSKTLNVLKPFRVQL